MSTDRFEWVEWNEESEAKGLDIIDVARQIYEVIEKLQPSRERSIAITKLDECVMWASQAIQHEQVHGTDGG